MPVHDETPPGEIIDAFVAAFERADLDVVWLPRASWLLWSRVAREGQALYENSPGVFHQFKLTAALRDADSGLWRALDRQFADRALQGRWEVDTRLVRRKLSVMFDYVRRLERVLENPEFETEYTLFHTAERLAELLVECAAKINAEVAQALAGIPPADYYNSFFSMQRTGWIDRETADALARAAGLRNNAGPSI